MNENSSTPASRRADADALPDTGKSDSLSAEDRAELAKSLERLERYAVGARSEATRRAYASDLDDFRAFCTRYGREWLPASPETVGL